MHLWGFDLFLKRHFFLFKFAWAKKSVKYQKNLIFFLTFLIFLQKKTIFIQPWYQGGGEGAELKDHPPSPPDPPQENLSPHWGGGPALDSPTQAF